MLIKHFNDGELFAKFLKEKLGLFYKEALHRSGEGVFHCVFFKGNLPPEPFFLSARKLSLHAYNKGEKFLVCGSEAKLKEFFGLLHQDERWKAVAREALESFIRYRRKYFKLVYNRKVLPLGLKTAVMGVLNVTPDSFSDGGLYLEPSSAVKRAVQMVEEGADIVDVGGESTRPGSKRVSAEEELRRVLPVLKEVRKELPDAWISVDTYKSEVAKACLEEGADIINDVSGGTFDPKMASVVAEYRCPYVINHLKGRPETWKKNPPSYEDPVEEIVGFFKERTEALKEAGCEEEKFILDPGIGFGKLPEHNVAILRRFEEFRILGKVLMVGVSRKSFIGIILEEFLRKKTEPRERLFGSLGALAPAVLGGAQIVRVHDVKETREFLALLDAVRTYDDL